MANFRQVLLLGTERSPQPPPPPHPGLAEAWQQLDWAADRERALLDALALTSQARAAATPATTPGAAPQFSRPAPSPTEPRAPAPAAAASLLTQLLDGELRPLLSDWLEHCARAECVLPPLLIPRLLSDATAEERRLLAPVLGTRGTWLLQQNSEWQASLAAELPPSLSAWEDGASAERLAWLRSHRASAPASAREALAATWNDESADFREEALATFVTGLSLEDEAFLAAALADKRKGVRQVAQSILVRLPGSALSQRMAARAQALLKVERGFLSTRLEIILPERFEPEWKADALEEKPPAGTGEKAWWTQQILACVPFSTVRKATGLTTHKLCALAAASEWAALLQNAWLGSLHCAPDEELAAELLEQVLASFGKGPGAQQTGPLTEALLPFCTRTDRWRLLRAHDGKGASAWHFLPHLGAPATHDEALFLLSVLSQSLRDGWLQGGGPQAVSLARLFPASVRDEAARLLQRENGLSRTAELFLRALDVRTSLACAFVVAPPAH